MAELPESITVAVESAVHKALGDVAQKCLEVHGIQINSVHFDWLDTSTPERFNGALLSIRADTTTRGG